MNNILFHPQLSMVDALRIAHAQGARLAWRDGRVRMAPASEATLKSMAAMIEMIDGALEFVSCGDFDAALATVRNARRIGGMEDGK